MREGGGGVVGLTRCQDKQQNVRDITGYNQLLSLSLQLCRQCRRHSYIMESCLSRAWQNIFLIYIFKNYCQCTRNSFLLLHIKL